MQKMMLRALAALLLFTCALAPVRAQDASAVLRLSVGFRTIKNTVKLSDETRAQVEALEKQAQAATNDKKYDEAYKHYSHALALMRNQPWTPVRALSTTLQVKPDKLVFDPKDAVRLTLTQFFAPDEPIPAKLNGTLTLKNASPDFAKELKTITGLAPDFSRPVTIDAALPDLPDGDYQMILTLRRADELKDSEPITKPIAVRVARGLAAEAAALKTRTASVATKLKADKQEKLLAALPAVEYAASMLDLVNAGQLSINTDLKAALADAGATLDQLAKGQDPLKAKRGDIRWAYRSQVDDTLQPFRFFVPSSYDAAKKWPLVVALHGMGGDENSFFDSYDKGLIKRLAEARGYLVVTPKGRGPAAMYMGTAERDVIDVLAEVKRLYSIDEDRVYLTGHSMGGYGSWSVATNHPEIFAAIAPFAGGGTPFITGRLRNIAHVPWFVVHGDADPTVPVGESRKMVKLGQDLGIEIKYTEVPGGDHVNIVVPNLPGAFDWFDAHKRQPKGAAKAASSGQN